MDLETRIIFIDAAVVAIDKPAGLPVDTPRRGGDSVEARLPQLQQGYKRLPAIMHRLDQDTSGCLLLARNPPARKWVQAAFERHEVRKRYVALLGGPVEGDAGVIDLPLAKVSSEQAGWRMVADPAGKPAVTNWKKLHEADGRTLVEFVPETGRTHQIRVHAREGLGVGIVGDRVYGFPGGPMLLHAHRLEVPRPKGRTIKLEAPLPEHFGEWAAFAGVSS
ncbi:RluA family pseudouridine synthase [Sphingomicrobium astaxanthinifaciens]|uniref:RluA family pseudouridine synthase n=1 Tax=Sphingomicrobium astaxanthinifaciens TaxID=1227949 RepID=UPI001FCCBEA7|nr:RluA family pseudouridine synthase [Sphingomicrobium astaxanthinifaciens]MCJ7421695.1 RluA family pseudouridine synthase [Sphingomicrobium astaxanthinifaciens]